MRQLLVSGTGTSVGKTIVTAALAALAGPQCTVVKLAQTGEPAGAGDMAEVRRLVPGVTGLVELARYPDPLSPEAAARRSGLPPLMMRAAVTAIGAVARPVIVEGAGGLLVRYDPSGWTIADLARELGAPVLLVVSAELGTLNHTAMAVEALRARDVALAGLVIGAWPASASLAARSNVADLEMIGGQPLAGALPEGLVGVDPVAFATAAMAGLSSDLGGAFDATAFLASVDG